MCRVYLMTWNAASCRWFKKWNGVQYAVAQRTLRKAYPHLWIAGTKEGSYQAANRWWQDKLATLQKHPHESQLDEAIQQRKYMAEWCCLDGQEETRKTILREIDLLREAKEKGTQLELGPCGLQLGKMLLNACYDPLPGMAKSVWHDRIEEAKRHLTFTQEQQGPTTSLRQLVDKFLAQKENERCPKAWRDLKKDILDFCDWWKCDNVELLRGLVLSEYRSHLLAICPTARTANNRLKNVKTLVNWLYEFAEAIDLPRNMRKLTITVEDCDIVTWTKEQVATLLANCSSEQQLHYLLMLNCGMYQGDVGQLLKSEINLELGTITRRRSKRKNGGLTVTYHLWPCVVELLKKHMSNHPTLALTDESGACLWEDTKGKSTKDTIGGRYESIKRKLDLPQLKALRKTGATLIANQFDKDLADYYLAHGTDDVADKHYIRHQNDRLLEATEALKQAFFG